MQSKSLLRLQFQRLRRIKFLFSLYLIFCTGVIGYYIYKDSLASIQDDFFRAQPLALFNRIFPLSYFFYVFFLFFAYEYSVRLTHDHLAETVASFSEGQRRYDRSSGMVLLFCALFPTLFVYGRHLIYLVQVDFLKGSLVLHLTWVVLLDLFLPTLVAIHLGRAISLFRSRLAGLGLLITLSFLSSALSQSLISSLTSPFGQKLFWPIASFRSIFYLFSPIGGDSMPLAENGFPLFPYRWALVLFWLCLAGLIRCHYLDRPTRHRQLRQLMCALAAAFSLFLVLKPSSKMIAGQKGMQDTFTGVQNYYLSHEQRMEAADFAITNYDLKLTILDQLYATAKLSIDQANLPVYRLTLHHDFAINQVLANEQTELSWTREGDYLSVNNPSGLAVESLTLTYRGYLEPYQVNCQMVQLPGYIPYYPQSGFLPLYDLEWRGYNRLYLDEATDFQVKVHGLGPFYSNLPEVSKHVFAGKAKGLLLMRGQYQTFEVDGIQITVPAWSAEYTAASLADDVRQIQTEGKLPQDVKRILLSRGRSPSLFNDINYYDDLIVMDSFLTYREMYEQSKIHPRKLSLYLALDTLTERPDEFTARLDMYHQVILDPQFRYQGTNQSSLIYLGIKDLLQTLPQDDLVAACRSFIRDDEDKRSGLDFILSYFGDLTPDELIERIRNPQKETPVLPVNPAPNEQEARQKLQEDLMTIMYKGGPELTEFIIPLLAEHDLNYYDPIPDLASVDFDYRLILYDMTQRYTFFPELFMEIDRYLKDPNDTREVNQVLEELREKEPDRPFYGQKRVSDNKYGIQYLVDSYLKDPAAARAHLEWVRKNGNADEAFIAKDPKCLIILAIDHLGEKVFLEKVETYLWDLDDQREELEFLNSLRK